MSKSIDCTGCYLFEGPLLKGKHSIAIKEDISMNAEKETVLEKVRRERGYIHPSREVIYKYDPHYLEIYHQIFTHVMKERNALPVKIKEMIIVAINASTNYEEGLWVHIKAALDAGASEEEIYEAIETASLPSGIHTMTYALPIFRKVCEEFRGARK